MAATRRRAVRSLVIGVIASVVLALLGAMGTDTAPLGQRLLYWAAVVLPGSLSGLAVTAAVRRWAKLAGRQWLEVLVVAVVVTIPHTSMVIVASALMFGLDLITPLVVAEFGLAVLIVSLVMTGINHLAARAAEQPSPPVQPEPADAAPAPVAPAATAAAASSAAMAGAMPAAFAERLPARIRGGQLRAICAQDHYLMVHTDVGSDLVLMRMADATALLAGVPGARVHRSWWVARDAVVGSRTDNGNLQLLLAGQLAVPVSRGGKAAAVQAGLLVT